MNIRAYCIVVVDCVGDNQEFNIIRIFRDADGIRLNDHIKFT